MAFLEVIPKRILVDDTPVIRVCRLNTHQKVTVAAHMYEAEQCFISYAQYCADEQGSVTNISSSSKGGNFQGEKIITTCICISCILFIVKQ